MKQVTNSPAETSEDISFRRLLAAFIEANGELPEYHSMLHSVLVNAPLTDVGNALRMYARYAPVVRWVSDWGCWLVWNGLLWMRDEAGYIVRYAKEMTGYQTEETHTIPFTEEEKENAALHFRWQKSSQSRGKLEAAIELLKSEPGITVTSSSLDADGYLINFRNGTLNLRTLDFRSPDKSDLMTKKTGVEYDPLAECPLWEAFMKKVTCEREDLSLYIQAVAGTGLCGQILDESLSIFHGNGGNGKTVHVEMVKEVLGDYACTATADLLTSKTNEGISNDVARLVGVRYLGCSETAEGKFLDEALVKALTGGDKIAARYLRREFFEFLPLFTPILLTNYPPVIRGTDSGIWRRLRLIPWDFDFSTDPEREDKPAVMAKLRNEGAGIMNWLITGLQVRLAAGSLDTMLPDVIKEATNRYREDSDLLGQFISETLFPAPEERMTKDEVYQLYKEYTVSNGGNPFMKKTLGTKLLLRGWKECKGTGGVRMWKGWRTRLDTDEDVMDAPPAPMIEGTI